MLGHHSILFNPFNTAGPDRELAFIVTISLHLVVALAFLVSHYAVKEWACASTEGCKCLTSLGLVLSANKVYGFAPKYSSKNKEGLFSHCYWSLLNWAVPECDIGEDYELDHKYDAATVEVSGARGPNAAHINGVYRPVAGERVGEKPVYKKDGSDTWIEYWPGKDQWQLKPASSKGTDAAYMHSLGTQKEAWVVEEVTDGWNVYDATTKVWSEQAGVRVVRLPGEAPVCVLRMLLRVLWRLSKSGMRIDARRILVASV
jgi:hypothetical protein